MRDVIALFVHAIVTIVRLAEPGGLRAVVAESVLVKHQLLILNRGRKRAPNLRVSDRIIAGLCALFMRRVRMLRSAIVVKPSTLLSLHAMLRTRKYQLLFSPRRGRRPGPKGPTRELIDAVVEMKRRNPTWGCPRIAEQIALAFGIETDKDVVRRILSTHYRPDSDAQGPSWLTFLGHTKDSLWSCDLFRCESAILRTYWVLIVMDQFTRRIVGFGVHQGIVDGAVVCRMFQRAIRGHSLPKYLSSDHDPLYRFHQWQANLRILDVKEIKTLPYVPLSHPFVERLIGTIRREYLDRVLFWSAADLETKLRDFQNYYNLYRTHSARAGSVPLPPLELGTQANLGSHRWRRHCGGLYQTPMAA
jgi:transposase InsO family protein